jgi:hypothetical protein
MVSARPGADYVAPGKNRQCDIDKKKSSFGPTKTSQSCVTSIAGNHLKVILTT